MAFTSQLLAQTGLAPGAERYSREAANLISKSRMEEENAARNREIRNADLKRKEQELQNNLQKICDSLNDEIKKVLSETNESKSNIIVRLRQLGPIIPSDLPALPVHKIADRNVGYLWFPDNWPSREDAELDKEDRGGFRVLRIINKNNLLVSVHDKITWITGISSQGIADDTRLSLVELFYVNGTKNFGDNTVFVLEVIHFNKKTIEDADRAKENCAILAAIDLLEPPNLARIRLKAKEKENIERYQKMQAEKEAQKEAAHWREWTQVDGTAIGNARFNGMGMGIVSLKKTDGTILKIKKDQLSEEDQAWIKKRR
jgi:hypothetical protein